MSYFVFYNTIPRIFKRNLKMSSNIKCSSIVAPLAKSENKKQFASMHTGISQVHPEFFFGGGADPEAIHKLCLILKSMLKIISKSPSQYPVMLQEKLQLAEKLRNLHIHTFY
jgi:hypothetical protein